MPFLEHTRLFLVFVVVVVVVVIGAWRSVLRHGYQERFLVPFGFCFVCFVLFCSVLWDGRPRGGGI